MRSVIRLLRPVLVVAVALTAGAATAGAASAQPASWQFMPVSAPAPPVGTPPAPYAVPLGQVGQISFWAPDSGLLITGGTEGVNGATSGGVVSAGVWAYDGVSWHQLSTVCGGSDGRIAWAGPDEFWTVSDQRPGQLIAGAQQDLQSLSLCHFVDGQVVASYALPLGEAGSYEPMDAAACEGSDDCWFGGYDTSTAVPGAFQLHWDGTNLTELQEPYDHSVNDMADYQGQVYESVRFAPEDNYLTGESETDPPVFHRIGTGEDGPFTPVDTFDDTQGPAQTLPVYGANIDPDALQGFALSTDGGPTGTSATALWAAADPDNDNQDGSPDQSTLTILRHTVSGWTQVTPAIAGTTPAACPAPGATASELNADYQSGTQGPLASYSVPNPNPVYANPTDTFSPTGTSDGAIAAMPGTDDAWLSVYDVGAANVFDPTGAVPEVALIDPSGCVLELDGPVAPYDSAFAGVGGVGGVYTSAFTQASDQSSAPGETGPIDCPADNDCWMVTQNGWLYNYTDGTQYPQDADPDFAGVITVRPSDGGTPTVYGDAPPNDDSGTATPTYVAPTGPAKKFGGGGTTRLSVRLTHVKAKIVHRTELELSFHLNIRARVQIIAQRHGKVVARSARRVLRPGRRTLTLRISLKQYPTHIGVNAKPAELKR